MVPFLEFTPNFFDIFRTRAPLGDLPEYVSFFRIICRFGDIRM